MDKTGAGYPALYDNGTNLWIGASAAGENTRTTGTVHISTSSGILNASIYVSKYDGSTWTNYVMLDAQNVASYALPVSGGTLTGILTAPRINLNRASNVASGISWYNSSADNYQMYMAPSGNSGQGFGGNLTTPTGTYVTSWAIRNVQLYAQGYGWTWEGLASGSTAPTIVSELSSYNGNFRTIGNMYAAAFYTTSDERLKTIKEPINLTLEDLLDLPLFYYELKDNPTINQIGTSAQKVKEKFPELVDEDSKGYLTLQYDKLSLLALKGIGLLSERLDNIEKQLNS